MILLAVGLGGISYWSMQRAANDIRKHGGQMLKETNRRFLASIISGQADTINHQLEQAKNSVTIGARMLDQELSSERFPQDETFEMILDNSGLFTTTIYFLALNGQATVFQKKKNHAEKKRVLLSDYTNFLPRFPIKAAPGYIVAWSEVHKDPYSEAYDRVIDAVSPMYVENHLVGYLGISVSVIRLAAQFNHHQAIRGSYNFLLDQNVRLIACPPLALVDLKPVGQTEIRRDVVDLSNIGHTALQKALNNMALGSEAVTRIALHGSEKYFSYRPLNNANFSLGLVVPVQLAIITTKQLSEAISQRGKTALLEMLLFSFILLGITLILVAVLSRKISRPLKDITNAANQISQGKLNHIIPIRSGDEVGILANSFNTMAHQIKLYIDRLTASENYLADIIDTMPSILIGVDREGKVTQWNRQAGISAGLTVTEALGLSLDKAFPEMVMLKERTEETIRTGLIGSFPKQKRKPVEGELRYEDVTIYPLNSEVKKGAVIRVDDVTERIRMEEVIIQNEKMLSIGGMAAGMAHEINNPLAGIIQNAAVLSNRLTDEKMTANIKAAKSAETTMSSIHKYMDLRSIPRMLEAIRDSGLRMASIVENMLSFARKTDSSFSSYNPVELLDNVLELAKTDYNLKKQYDFKSISIKKEYETHLPSIDCEGSKMQQVLLNILNNGAHAMFARGKNEDAPDPEFILRLSCKPDSNMLQIEIEDNGIGMDAVTRKKIFEPFFTTKPVGVGTGLGLSVSYFIIKENHGGEMDVVSEQGKGTNFIIRLPLKR